MIKVEHVSKTYPNGVKGLQDINLEIEDGEFVGIIGMSGAGKSTFIRTINRLNNITEGKLTVDGVEISNLKGKALRRFRRKVGMIFQSYNLVPRITVIRNVMSSLVPDMPLWRVILGLFSKNDKMRALEALDRVSMLDKAFVRTDQLSGGQQQRVSIARVLAMSPELLLLDEPTSALDPISSRNIEETLLKLREDYAMIIVTHSMSQASRISDRTAFFLSGDLIEVDQTKHIFLNPQKQETQDYVSGRFG